MGNELFSYEIHKDDVVRVFWENRCVLTLGGSRGKKLAARLAAADDGEVQGLLQRATGNFRRGNERAS
jgi:hypothetical protein